MCIDWSNFISTLVGAFAGALGAYCFNLKQTKDQQKDIEKAKLLKLFYDINILLKTFVYHHQNIVAEIGDLVGEEIQSIIPITIKDSNFRIEEYGFLTKFSPAFYETLTYVHHDINYIYEQQDILEKFIGPKVKLYMYLERLEHIKVSTVKLLAKLFVSLINANNSLVKYYKCENLIKNEVTNAYIRSKKIMDKTISDYENILNAEESNKQYDEFELDTIKADLEYINEILNLWVIDFGLNNAKKIKVDKEVKEQVKKRWEVPENAI